MHTQIARLQEQAQKLAAAGAAQQQQAAQPAARPAPQQAAAALNARQEPGLFAQLRSMVNPFSAAIAVVAIAGIVQRLRDGWPFSPATPQPAPQPGAGAA